MRAVLKFAVCIGDVVLVYRLHIGCVLKYGVP